MHKLSVPKLYLVAGAIFIFALTAVYGYGTFSGSKKHASLGNQSASAATSPDINSDGTVNVFDLSILLAAWGTSATTSDLNSDGTVNVFDLSILLSKWGPVASPTPTPTPTLTPTPTPTPSGTPVAGACPAFPAFPNASCTGVPSGYPLTTVASFSSSSNGQVIDGKLITGDLTINNNNVTVTNSRIKGVVLAGSHTGLTLQNVDVGPDSCPASGNGSVFAVNSDGFTLIRTHVHSIPNDLLRIGGGSPYVIRDSIIDGTCIYPGDHLDAIQWYDPGGVNAITIIHNVIDVRPANSPGDTGNAALFWADGAGAGTTLSMYNNLLAGGGYTTALYDAVKGSGTVLDVHDNVYVKNSYQYAPCSRGSSVVSILYDGTSGVKFTNNKLDDGTAVTCN